MRPALSLAVVGPILLLAYPVLRDPEPSLVLDLLAALLAAGFVGLAVRRRGRGRSETPWLVAAALVWVALATALRSPDALTRWPVATSWTLAVVAGVAASGIEPLGPRRRVTPRLLATAALTVVAAASPLLEGPAAVELVPIMVLFSAAAVGAGLLHRAQTHRLARQRLDVRDREREAMARDLHDVIAHEVTGIVVLAQAVRRQPDDRADDEAMARIEAAGRRALRDIRAIVAASRDDTRGTGSTSVHPRGLADLERLVADFAPTTDARTHLDVRGDGQVSASTAGAAYRIVAEALSNARRHASDASRIDVVLDTTGPELVLEVRDDGSGTTSPRDPGREGSTPAGPARSAGWGLTGIAERADLVGGTVETGPAPGGGWRVRAVLPSAGPTA